MNLSFAADVCALPSVFCSRAEVIDEGREHRAERQRAEQSVGAIKHELNVSGAGGQQQREKNSSLALVRCRFRIGDHEEREEQERTALQLLQRDRRGIAEPKRSPE